MTGNARLRPLKPKSREAWLLRYSASCAHWRMRIRVARRRFTAIGKSVLTASLGSWSSPASSEAVTTRSGEARGIGGRWLGNIVIYFNKLSVSGPYKRLLGQINYI
jgi:hypothetical protein